MKNQFFLVAFFAAANFAQGQESVNTSGGVNVGTGGTVSYSVGQMVYTTDSKESGAVVQGVQRPNKITTTEIKKLNDKISFKVYPNPSSDDLCLEMNKHQNEKLVYQMFDVQGKQMMMNPIESPETKINLRSFASGTYTVQIYDSKNQPIQTLQIIKN
jgi:hypothetical protein